MSGYKEFEGKTLDDAIRDACSWYDTTREKLEVEILSDAKGGIFGLVGAKKARIRARLVEFSSVLEGLDGSPAKDKGKKQRPEGEGRQSAPRKGAADEAPKRERGKRQTAEEPETALAAKAADVQEAEPAAEAAAKPHGKERQEGRPRRGRGEGKSHEAKPRENGKRHEKPVAEGSGNGLGDADLEGEDLRRVSFDQLDAAELESAAKEIVTRLTEPFLGETTITVTIANDRVRVCITDVADPGLLIGRDGQTLASLQYLVTRMLSNRLKALLRVQIDAGDYRERQDERLREMALSLAEKVKAGGRPQVTRPLSSYHRRVIHVTLQDDPLIQTHSKGEGELKRVMVARRKERA